MKTIVLCAVIQVVSSYFLIGQVLDAPKFSSDSSCRFAKHRISILHPYLIIFDGDTINQYRGVKNNLKYGRWVYFRRNGFVKTDGYYEFGVKQGYWRYYSRKNELIRIMKYRNGQVIEFYCAKTGKTENREYKRSKGIWELGESRFIEKGNCNESR